MITYEITAQVRSDLVEEYETYMRERHDHFPEGIELTRENWNVIEVWPGRES